MYPVGLVFRDPNGLAFTIHEKLARVDQPGYRYKIKCEQGCCERWEEEETITRILDRQFHPHTALPEPIRRVENPYTGSPYSNALFDYGRISNMLVGEVEAASPKKKSATKIKRNLPGWF